MSEYKTTDDIEELYGAVFTPLFRYVFFRTHDYDVACDVTQQSFLKFMQKNSNYSSVVEAQKILFVIARHTLIDMWRANTSRKTQSVDNLDLKPTYESSIEETLITAEDVTYIKSLLSKLSATEADIVTMRLADEMAYKTIASILELTEENVRQIYSRALKKLRTQVIARQ